MWLWVAISCWCFICGVYVGYMIGKNRREEPATHGELKVTKDE